MFDAGRLASMTGAITHRGPDDEHFHIEPGVALGARRLSIVDLAGGRQPLCNEDGSIWVAFNGELFDYPELRAELLAKGHTLSTRCDTESWVHLYEEMGEGMLLKAKGQFAVSLWDRSNRRAILGRDRIGISPLYYAVREGWLLFGSEVKSLLASGLVRGEPDPKGIDHLFNFFCAGTTRTFFKDVNCLAPGHYLDVRDGKFQKKQYWDLSFPDAGQEVRMGDPAPLVDDLEELLRKAVERRLRGDVPVVSYISGGLDSTVVLGLSSRQRGKAVPSFTIALDGAGPDERSQSAEAASVLGSPLTTVTMDRKLIAEAFPELVVAAEGPVLDTSCACLMRLARAVHDEGYKVVLTGEGADEAFAGYVWFKGQKVRDAIAGTIGNGLPRLAFRGALAMIGGDKKKRAAERAIHGVRTAQQDLYDFLGESRGRIYSDRMWTDLGDHNPYSDLDLTNRDLPRWHPLNQSLYVGYKVMLAGLLMVSKGDRISMHSSVEARYPFLDEDVIQFASTVSPDYKLRGMREKWLLRQVAAKTLPERIANRPKTMFRASLAGTFLGPHRPAWVDQLLSPESLRKTGYFDPEAVARERAWQVRIPRMTMRRIVFDLGLTSVVSTQLWHHLFCGGGLCDLPTWEAPEYAGNRTPGHYKTKQPDDALQVAAP
jgi:asparagine synthase (glutamine-hydrolysing)